MTTEHREPGFWWFKHDPDAVMMGARARGIDIGNPEIRAKLQAELADELDWQIVKVDRQGLVWSFGVGAADMQSALQMARAIGGPNIKASDIGIHYSRILGEWGSRVKRYAVESH